MDKDYFLSFLNEDNISTFDFMLEYVNMRGIENSIKTRTYLKRLLGVPLLSNKIIDSAIDYCINKFDVITLYDNLPEKGGNIIKFY